MSWQPCDDADCTEDGGLIRFILDPKEKDLGGFSVRRVLPSAKQRLVGPFVFFDHMGPAKFPPGKGIDVRPHPHIGLATITWLFDGEILHRDSLGFVQPIRPGAVNWMTAGKGIVHSERSGDAERAKDSGLHGIQAWIALPEDQEDIDPSFEHYPADKLPKTSQDGVHITLISGKAFGMKSSVKTLSPQFYAELLMDPGSAIDLPDFEERAVYVVHGSITVGGKVLTPTQMAILNPGPARIEATEKSLVMVLGGAKLSGKRTVWWNFVSTSKDKIEEAKVRWKNGEFDQVPGEDEFIPLPE